MVGKPIDDYETLLKRLLAAASRPKPFATEEKIAFWEGQRKAFEYALKRLPDFSGRIFHSPDSEKGQKIR